MLKLRLDSYGVGEYDVMFSTDGEYDGELVGTMVDKGITGATDGVSLGSDVTGGADGNGEGLIVIGSLLDAKDESELLSAFDGLMVGGIDTGCSVGIGEGSLRGDKYHVSQNKSLFVSELHAV